MLETPFADVVMTGDGFSLPELKWREMIFTGAMRAVESHFERDIERPLPAFVVVNLFPPGVHFKVQKSGGRVYLKRV